MAAPREDGTEIELLSREELEARVRERTAYLENLMDTMVDVLLVLDGEGRIELANEAATSILGYDEGSLTGKPVDVLFARTEENQHLSDALGGGAFVERLLAEGQVTDLEIYFSTADGEAIPMSVSASLMRDDGAVTGIVCVAKDIGERKAAEESSTFLYSVLRHDLGNKLQVTRGYLELIRDADPDELDEYLDTAVNSLDEAAELIASVEMLDRIEGHREPEPTRLDDVLAEAIARHEDLLAQHGLTVENRVDAGYRVLADPLLKELFANLVENAAIHSGGSRLEVSARETEAGVVVTFVDDGRGTPDDRKERIFEKGAKGSGSRGSGLGMHLVDRIAESYGGDVEVADAETGGARFDVTLPRADDR